MNEEQNQIKNAVELLNSGNNLERAKGCRVLRELGEDAKDYADLLYEVIKKENTATMLTEIRTLSAIVPANDCPKYLAKILSLREKAKKYSLSFDISEFDQACLSFAQKTKSLSKDVVPLLTRVLLRECLFFTFHDSDAAETSGYTHPCFLIEIIILIDPNFLCFSKEVKKVLNEKPDPVYQGERRIYSQHELARELFKIMLDEEFHWEMLEEDEEFIYEPYANKLKKALKNSGLL